MPEDTRPPEPQHCVIPDNWAHKALHKRVRDAIFALPSYFETPLYIEGVPATDLFTLNSALGASIEDAMVACLNDLREVWDPEGCYKLYSFIRQPQTFPDVRLQRNDGGTDPILMGIELKGWFVLSKEGEPSFRYKVTPTACAPQDLLVVVPWIFRNVISGKPILMTPLVTEARYAAEMRNYHWEFVRNSKSSPDKRGIQLSRHTTPYPAKNDKCSDMPIEDGGSNFGRIARCNVFDSEVKAVMQQNAAGVPIGAWHKFISIFTENSEPSKMEDKLGTIAALFALDMNLTTLQRTEISTYLKTIAQALMENPCQPIEKSKHQADGSNQ